MKKLVITGVLMGIMLNGIVMAENQKYNIPVKEIYYATMKQNISMYEKHRNNLEKEIESIYESKFGYGLTPEEQKEYNRLVNECKKTLAPLQQKMDRVDTLVEKRCGQPRWGTEPVYVRVGNRYEIKAENSWNLCARRARWDNGDTQILAEYNRKNMECSKKSADYYDAMIGYKQGEVVSKKLEIFRKTMANVSESENNRLQNEYSNCLQSRRFEFSKSKCEFLNPELPVYKEYLKKIPKY